MSRLENTSECGLVNILYAHTPVLHVLSQGNNRRDRGAPDNPHAYGTPFSVIFMRRLRAMLSPLSGVSYCLSNGPCSDHGFIPDCTCTNADLGQ